MHIMLIYNLIMLMYIYIYICICIYVYNARTFIIYISMYIYIYNAYIYVDTCPHASICIIYRTYIFHVVLFPLLPPET